MILIDDIKVKGNPLKIWGKTHPRATRFRLRFDETHEGLVVTLPPKANLRKAKDFVQSALPWIEKTFRGTASRLLFEENTLLSVLGQDLHIRFLPERRSSVHIQDGVIHVRGPSDNLDLLVRHVLRGFLLDFCTKESEAFAAQLGTKIHGLQIRNTKSRWGSCSSKGTLSFSSRLVFAPTFAARYVCAHEVCHLREMNHGPKFWRLVEDLDPHYKNAKEWLKSHGHQTSRYGEI